MDLPQQSIAGFREPVGSDWVWVLLWVFGMAFILAGSWYLTLRGERWGLWKRIENEAKK